MSTHFCKVGTVRPNLNKGLNSKEIELNSVEQKSNTILPLGKLSKKTA